MKNNWIYIFVFLNPPWAVYIATQDLKKLIVNAIITTIFAYVGFCLGLSPISLLVLIGPFHAIHIIRKSFLLDKENRKKKEVVIDGMIVEEGAYLEPMGKIPDWLGSSDKDEK